MFDTLAADCVRTVYTPTEPVALLDAVWLMARGGDGPCFRRIPGGVWLTMRTPHGPASLRLTQGARGTSGVSQIDAAAWGPGAEWAIDGVPELLGRDDDWSALDVSASPLLSEVRRRNPGMRIGRNRLVFEMFVPAVMEQKVTAFEAWRAWRLLVRRYGEPAPGPVPAGMMVAPSAEGWRLIPSWDWHKAGVGPQRSQTVVRSARLAEALERTLDADHAEAERRLMSLPGVGVWTAAEVTLRAHGNPDAVSVGDYHLASTVGVALTGSPVDDDGMLELLEPWRGHRQRVLRLILRSGIHKERHGPKMTVQDHRGH